MKFRFDSVSEIVEAAQTPFVCASNAADCEEGDRPGFICLDRTHVRTPKQAIDALSEPLFPVGVRRVEDIRKRIEAPTPIQVRRVPVRSDSGDELDIERVWQGDLDNAWRAMRRASRVGPSRVLIATNAMTSAHTPTTDLAVRGAAAIALAVALREAGHTVQISTAVDTYVFDREKTAYQVEVVVCGCGDEIDIHKLASLMASGLLLRGILFRHMWRVAPGHVSLGLCPGRTTLSDKALDITGFDYVAICENDCMSEHDAQAWITKHVAAIDARARGES